VSDFRSRVSNHLALYERHLTHRLIATPGTDTRLKEAMHYAIFNGGKRLRPQLVFATAEALNIDPNLLLSIACAVELIHCYSLVHDDLPAMDDDDLRRGRPTTHLAYDEATAILVGDALQALAYQLLADDPLATSHPKAVLRMLLELTEACGADGMAGGQAWDLQLERQSPDQSTLEKMFAMKTGALIRASVLMPCFLNETLSDAALNGLRAFGEHLGLAFQIRDDLLDIEGNAEIIGKPVGSDLAKDKATWPGLFGIPEAKARISTLHEQAMAGFSQAKPELSGDTSGLLWLADQLTQRDH
jgi:farnesyl diphosphate synthase